MGLSKSRVVFAGETPYGHERRGIDFVVDQLPDHDPYMLWALVDYLDPSSGRVYEIDLLVIGYGAVYLIELKDWEGRIEGDHVDWYLHREGRKSYREAPLRLAAAKARVLGPRLRQRMKRREHVRVEPLIFLSHEKADVRGLSPEGRIGVVTRDDLARALTFGEYPGADPSRRRARINAPTMRDVARVFDELGIRPRRGQAHAGSYELGEELEAGAGYVDREGVHRDNPGIRCRARTYLVPEQTSQDLRQRLRRAAARDAENLHDVREHRGVLRFIDFIVDAPLGPTVLFEPFDGGERLDSFLRRHRDLSFDQRAEILLQAGGAVAHCHRRDVVHGALSPEAVLVRHRDERRRDDGKPEVRLYNFQLSWSRDGSATSHRSTLFRESYAVYQAPELREDPRSGGPGSDVFSLGALAYTLFTGQPPAASVAEVDERLRRDGFLDARAGSDRVPEAIADLIEIATCATCARRTSDVEEWIALFEEYRRRPQEEDREEPNPLLAGRDDVLPGGLRVVRTLGHGASSRVIEVERDSDGRRFALKVSLGEDHDQRLEGEAMALGELRHPRIVQLHAETTIGGRRCLLLSLAGERTLQQELVSEGPVALDYAMRYGEDLLQAVAYLEERGLPHRDVKPANLGVGAASKKAKHLTLFDFSLVGAARGEIEVGTSGYRDPFLRKRGAWDNAADRWSAAVTLHEMLTGTRPQLGGTSVTESPEVRLAAERFDPSVRDQLIRFFERALRPDADGRFPSADDMRRAWLACFEAPRPRPQEKKEEKAELAVEGIESATPIAALPLSARAKNALDRAGLTIAEDLLRLPENRLSAMRSVGTKVAGEILDLRRRWREVRPLPEVQAEPFCPGYRGDDRDCDEVLPGQVVDALRYGAIRTLGTLAVASQKQVRRLAERHGFDVSVLREVLDDEQQAALERRHPTQLEGWLDALLPAGDRWTRQLRVLFGLEEPLKGKLGANSNEAAEALEVERRAVSLKIVRARKRWRKHADMPGLGIVIRSLVEAAGGVLPLKDAAGRLLAELPHHRELEPELLTVRAAALVRVVCEVERDDADGLCLLMIDSKSWVCRSDAHAHGIERLGRIADALAQRAVLASAAEAARAFADEAEGTPLESLAGERLAEIAVAASKRAARSTRLEIYPRGMDAGRALDLTAAVLSGELTPDRVRERVAARYPEAEPLPPRPELDALLDRLGLKWDEAARRYVRPGVPASSSLRTMASSLSVKTTALPGEPRSMSAESLAARDFGERLRTAIERRYFRVLGVTADRAGDAVRALDRKLGLAPRPLDKLLIEEIHRLCASQEIPEETIHEVDRLGPAGPGWKTLCGVMEEAAEGVCKRLLPAREPLLLVQPGLIARYRLERFLKALVAAAGDDESEAIFLLVPTHDTGGMPRINGVMPIPDLLPAQHLWMSRDWLENRDAAAASTT